ncbi:hypothetical protein CDAR_501191 [Caerostris darwini]|uniref:Uncharacterized protein n=1 Tax=Caerostris darwini TaxID=1538125 RepID=A0AAV4NMJ5_9ARAC|nr:hypothetical protein CDAR_501191 [Caerostris darwini]
MDEEYITSEAEYGKRFFVGERIITFDRAHHCPGEADDNLFLVTWEVGLLRGFCNFSLVGSLPKGAGPHSERIYGNVHVLNVTKKCFCHGLIATWDERDCPDRLSGRWRVVRGEGGEGGCR